VVLAKQAWHGCFTLLANCNPGIFMSGLAMDSKSATLAALGKDNPRADAIATWTVLPAGTAEDQLHRLEHFMHEQGLSFPLVLKPDEGQRGKGVAIIRSKEEAVCYLRHGSGEALIAQRYVGGLEFGVFYTRLPGAAQGRIVSLAQKHPLSLVADGRSTLEELVLAHPRAVAMAGYYRRKFADVWHAAPPAGTQIKLTEIGTHCRGAVFTDERQHITPELEAAVEALTRPFSGFYHGRYDLRVPSLEDLRMGRNLQVLELNGVAAEPAHIYQPGYPFLRGLSDLTSCWLQAVRIGAELRAQGHQPPSLANMVAAIRAHGARQRMEADDILPASSTLRS
jgi:hypothetical protein